VCADDSFYGMSALASPSTTASPLADILAAGGVRSVYQPVVALPDRRVVAYEALARGPVGSPLESPGALFGVAAAEGATADLDRACRAAAVDGALGALDPSTALLVNVEPDVLDPVSDVSAPALERAAGELTVIAEITERRLTHRPAELLRAVAALRRRGWGFALDDVGADWRSIALMPFLRPDVVKLDMRLVQEPFGAEAAAVVRAVRAYADETGAAVLAEGIETEEHERRALSWGATLGQGWFYGRPAALPAVPVVGGVAGGGLVTAVAPVGTRTPAQVAQAAGAAFSVAPKGALLAHSIAIEHRALADPDPVVALGCFQSARHFTPATARRYTRLARRSAFVGAFGTGLDDAPVEGVRGASLHTNEALAGEWNVIVVGPHQAAALIAVDLRDGGADMERRFAYTLIEDRDLVLRAARSLMLRITGA
jgi:EAL domain-containing protein (putative c-di-GMP-specific phosphodiesterase class I)